LPNRVWTKYTFRNSSKSQNLDSLERRRTQSTLRHFDPPKMHKVTEPYSNVAPQVSLAVLVWYANPIRQACKYKFPIS